MLLSSLACYFCPVLSRCLIPAAHVVLPAEAGMLGIVFDALGEDARVIGHQQLVILLAHDDFLADQVLLMHILQRQRDLQGIGRTGLVDRIRQHVDHGDEIECREVRVVATGAPVIGEFFGFGHLEIDGDVTVELHDRGQAVLAGRSNRGRAANQVREKRVEPHVEPGIDRGLDQEVEVAVVIAGDDALRAGGLDLGHIGREVLHLAEWHQFVADDLDVGTQLRQPLLGVALDRLAEQIVLVQEVNLLQVRRQRLDAGGGAHIDRPCEAEVPEVALLVGQLGRERAAVQIEDAIVGIAGVVLGHRVYQGRADIRSGAMHYERNILVRHALERDQRFGGLQLVVERNEFVFLPQGAAGRVLARDDILENLQEFVATRGERTRERVGIG
jgi:hypothetical protein